MRLLIPKLFTRRAKAQQFSEGNNTLNGVEIFEVGKHRGKDYTSQDLDDMVRNFDEFCKGQKPGFHVPAVLGHEEDQDLLDRSDLPAAGWASHIYREGDKLLADFDDVPDEIADLVRNKRYRTCSSEVYDQPPEGIPGKGKMIRRVAFLGGDIPQLKNLHDLPMPNRHAEDRRFAQWRRINLRSSHDAENKRASYHRIFHEATPMSLAKFGPDPGSKQSKAMWAKMTLSGAKKKDGSYSPRKYKKGTPKGGWGFDEDGNMDKDSVLDALAEAGGNRELLSKIPDDALGEVCRMMTDAEEGDGDQQQNDDEPPADDNDMPTDHSDAAGNDVGSDSLPDIKTEQEAREYAEHVRRHAEHARSALAKYCSMGRHAEGGESAPAQPVTSETSQPKKTTVTHQYSERDMERFASRAVERALESRIKDKIDRFEKFTETQLAAQKKATIEAFCESRLKAGKILPSELDTENNPANLFDRLMRADASTPVRKFREGKKDVSLTELDLQMREIDARPARMFSEKVKAGKAGNGSADDDIEVEKVSEAFDRFSEVFPKGTKKEDLIAGYKAEKKHHPEVTAADFLEGFDL